MGEFRLLDSGRTKLIWQNIHKWKRFCLNSAVGPLEKITDVSVTTHFYEVNIENNQMCAIVFLDRQE